MVVRGRMGQALPADHVQGIIVHHLAADDAVEAEVVGVVVTAGLLVTEVVNPELGLGGVPGGAVVEGDAFPEVEPPAVGLQLFPALDAGQSDHLITR